MILQTLLFLAAHLLGISLCLGFGPARRTHLVGALGFITGLAAIVALELGMMCIGVRFTVARAIVLLALMIAGSLRRARRRGVVTPRACVTLALWTLGFVIGSLALSFKNLSMLSYDSHYIVMMGMALADDGVFAPGMLAMSGDYGAFMMLGQSLVMFTRSSYLWGLAPVFAASSMVLFGVTLHEALDALHVQLRGRAVVVTLLTAATFTIYMLFRHSFYIHTNFGTATYLFVFCVLFWLAEIENDTAFLPIAFLALFALALHRIEAPLVCVLFAVLAVLPSRLPRRPLLIGVAAVALGTLVLTRVLASALSPTSDFLTPKRCYMLAGVLLALVGYLALSTLPRLRFLEQLNRRAPALVAVACTLALVVAFALRWGHFASSARAWIWCLLFTPYWEGPWPVIAGFALLGLLVPAPPHRWLFVVGVPAYMALMLLLVWGRAPYYVGLGDSASRMAIHVVPMAMFYLGLKFIPLLARTREQSPAAAAPGH